MTALQFLKGAAAWVTVRHAESDGGERAMDYAAVTRPQKHALRIVSTTIGGISMVLTVVAVGWFLRMKRGFRHE